jgi:hypothetical protein
MVILPFIHALFHPVDQLLHFLEPSQRIRHNGDLAVEFPVWALSFLAFALVNC